MDTWLSRAIEQEAPTSKSMIKWWEHVTNELNTSAQMIFTVHDINLMDCKRMFRKEQIWFVHKDEEGVYVYSLADFTAQQGVRDTTDVMEKYRKGALGALPDPELINSLLSIKGDVKGDDADAK